MPGQMYVPCLVGIRPESMGRPDASTSLAQFSLSHEGCSLQELAIGPVENIEKAVAIGLHQQATGYAVLFDIHQHGSLIGVVVIEVVWSELEIPFQFSGVGVDAPERKLYTGRRRGANLPQNRALRCWWSNRECRVRDRRCRASRWCRHHAGRNRRANWRSRTLPVREWSRDATSVSRSPHRRRPGIRGPRNRRRTCRRSLAPFTTSGALVAP